MTRSSFPLQPSHRFLAVALLSLLLNGCGSGGSSTSTAERPAGETPAAGQPSGGSPSPSGPSPTSPTTPNTGPDPANPTIRHTAAQLGLTACAATGIGKDYVIGDGPGQLPSLDQVPWESLAAGDTVRLTYRETPYYGKMLIAARGTAAAPVRVCGIPGPNGERPIVDGRDAVTRAGLRYNASSLDNIQETRSVIMIDRLGTDVWSAPPPSYVQIDGLEIRGANPSNQFTNSFGARQAYVDFGACIWVDRGQHIVIADNEIHDCTQGVFTRSVADGDFSVTRNIRIAGNHIYGNGLVGRDTLHNAYLQSIGVVIEFNVFGAPRAGARGNAIKDRSVGTVVRYNRIEEGAHAIDLVEAEDFAPIATADPAYRRTYVYGNQIIKNGDTGSFIHYGGDHYGCCEQNFRQGTLYFFHNTVIATGGSAALFQISTTLERAEIWNNVFAFASSVAYPSMRSSSEIGPGYTAGGIVVLGRNWITSGWADTDPYHTVPGSLTGHANMLTGSDWPVDGQTLIPLAGSSIIGAGQAAPDAAALGAHAKVEWQIDRDGSISPRATSGAGADLGAIQR